MQYTLENLKLVFKSKQNYSIKDLQNLFKIKEASDVNQLLYDLKALEITGIIFKNKNEKYQSFPSEFILGTVKIAYNGFGYIYLNNNRYNIHPVDLKSCLNNDLCVLQIDDDRKSAIVKSIIKRNNEKVVCEFNNNVLTTYGVIPKKEVLIDDKDIKRLVDGTRILVKIGGEDRLEAISVEVIGHRDDPDVDLITIALNNEFDIEFSKASLEELENIPTEVNEEDLVGRLDLRKKIIYTIDCDTAKDMDDGISIELNENGNYVVGVYIANVSHYIQPNMHLFKEALQRGTSLYFADKVVPMLPKQLSNGICSLNPNVDRLSKHCIMELTPDGKLVDYKIGLSVINSKKKMFYSQVNEFLEKGKIAPGYEPFADNLALMNKFSKVLDVLAEQRGYISFAETDVTISLDSNNNPLGFNIARQGAAEKLIENLMLLANETVANHYGWSVPFIFRVHDVPSTDKMSEILEMLKIIGYKIPYIKNFDNPRAVQGLLKSLKKIEDYPILSNLILRGLKKAIYSTENIGHFGLAYDFYTHFTSPIRRSSDLMVHTIMDLYEKDLTEKDFKDIEKMIIEVANHASHKEKCSIKAEYEANLLKMAEYMESHIGEEYEGIVTNVRSSIIDVKTSGNILGSVFLPDIKDDFYTFDKDRFVVVGKKTKNTYKIGDKINLRVLSSDTELKLIRFEILNKLNLQIQSDKCKRLVR